MLASLLIRSLIPSGSQKQAMLDKQAASKPWPTANPALILLALGSVVLFSVLGYKHALAEPVAISLAVILPLVFAVGYILQVTAQGMHEGYQSYKSTRPNPGELARAQRVVALISTNCPTCYVGPNQSCKPDQRPYAIVDRKWNTLSHFTRIERSVKFGYAARADVIAQFGGTLPKGLNI